MRRLTKKRSAKAGKPPGTLIHIGEKKTAAPRITVFNYDETHFEELELKKVEECFDFKDQPTVTWINVDGLHDVELIEKICNGYGIHSLVQEDIVNTDQRPKLEVFDNYLYLVLKMLYFNGKKEEVIIEQVSLVLGSNFVLSFQEAGEDVFDPIRERIRSGKGRIRKMGADFLAYLLLDAVVDSYFIILEKLGEKIEFLEDALVANPTPKTLQAIHHLKREMIFLRKSVWPLREVISALGRGDSPLGWKRRWGYT